MKTSFEIVTVVKTNLTKNELDVNKLLKKKYIPGSIITKIKPVTRRPPPSRSSVVTLSKGNVNEYKFNYCKIPNNPDVTPEMIEKGYSSKLCAGCNVGHCGNPPETFGKNQFPGGCYSRC